MLKALHGFAFGEGRAAPELLADIGPCFTGANNQGATAFRALPLGCRIATAFEVLHVLAVGGEGWRAAAGLEGVQHGVDFRLAEYLLLE